MKVLFIVLMTSVFASTCKSVKSSPAAELANDYSQVRGTCKDLARADYTVIINYLKKVTVTAKNDSVLRAHWVDLNTGKTSYEALQDPLVILFSEAEKAEKKSIIKEALDRHFVNIDWESPNTKTVAANIIQAAALQGRLVNLRDLMVRIYSEHSTKSEPTD